MSADTSQRGFVTLVSVIMLLAVSVAAALVAFLAAWQSADGQAAWMSHLRARNLADACAETARATLWTDSAYTGSESFDIGGGSCAILPIQVSSLSYDVRAEGYSISVTARTHAVYELSVDASGSVQSLNAVLFEHVADW